MLNIYERTIKVLEGRNFYLTYLIFCIKQTIKVLESKRIYLTYLIAQEYKQIIKALENKRFCLIYLIFYKSCYKVRK